ncbi:MAG: PAS domain S-box protein [Alphaproteobacteria bacterium]|nr:PAS domain S-box protein [Alphaproteobacteria bacterium]
MKFRTDVKIGNQISAIAFTAFVGFLVILGMEFQSSNAITKNSERVVTELQELSIIRDIQHGLSTARLNEKDYLASQQDVALWQFYQQLNRVKASVDALRKFELAGAEEIKLRVWEEQLVAYGDQFSDMSRELNSIGLSESQGVRGTMRNAIHIVERKIATMGGTIYRDLLQVRRHEKDYIIRRDASYFASWQKSVTLLEQDIAIQLMDRADKSSVTQSLSLYINSFNTLRNHYTDLAKDTALTDGMSKGLLNSINSVFKTSSDEVIDTARANYAIGVGYFRYLVIATILIGTFVFVAARVIASGIRGPIKEMADTMKRLARGETQLDIPAIENTNEIGDMARAVLVFRDTARKRAEGVKELQQAKLHTENIINSMSEALFEVDADGKIIRSNPAGERLLGAQKNGLKGLDLAEFVSEDENASKDYTTLKLIQSSLEKKHMTNPVGFQGLIADAPLPLILTSDGAKIIFANKIAHMAFGYAPNEMTGLRVEDLLPASKRTSHTQHVTTYSHEIEPRTMAGGIALGAQNKAGEEMDVMVGLMPLNLNGKNCILGVLRRKNIDPTFAEIGNTEFGRLFTGFEMDPRVLRLLHTSSSEVDTVQFMLTTDGRKIPVSVSGGLIHSEDKSRSGAIFVARDISRRLASEMEIRQFKSTLDRVDGKVYMFDPDTLKMIYSNRSARKRSEQISPDIYHLTPMDLDPTISEQQFRAHLQPLIDGTEKTISFETVQFEPDGREIPEEVVVQLIKPADQPARFVVFVTDITKRKQADREINKFKATLDATEDAIFMFRPDSLEFIYINNTARKQVGWNNSEHIGKTPGDINPVFSEERFRKMAAPLVYGTQTSVTIESIGLNFKPSEFILELFDEDHTAETRFVLTCRDISERKEAEKNILQFKKTLDLSQDEIYMFWPDSLKYIYLNDAARRLSGWSCEEYITKTLMDNNKNFDPKEFREITAPLLNGEKKSIVYEKIGKNDRPIEVSLQLLKPQDQTARFVAITRDISERKATERAKSEFISTVSHELRTPLTSIKGALGLLKAGAAGEMNEKSDSLVTMALNNSDRLVRLINDILDIEKFEAGRMEFHLEPMDMADLVRQAVEANKNYGVTRGVTFEASGIANPVTINGDKDRLMQVMANLMSNAAKFSDSGATVKIALTKRNGKARISVKDTGSGIPIKAQATIFDKFTQADSSDQRAKGGTGLGLNIVKMMVEAHDSSVHFKSKPGKGTTFFFEIDLLEKDEKVLPIKPIAVQASARLLVCEDDEDIADLLKIMLTSTGYQVDIANTAAQAKELLATTEYDAMTLDLGLPDQDGLSLLRDMRAQPALENLPVVVVSASAPDKNSDLKADGVNIFDWVQKPVNSKTLKSLMERAVRNTPSVTPKILHVEDEGSVREIVKTIVGDHAEIISATSVASAKKMLSKTRYDLVILDLSLPDGDGQELLPLLHKSPQNATPVLVFSAQEADSRIVAGVEAVMVKSRVSNEDLLGMIDTVIAQAKHGNRAAAE